MLGIESSNALVKNKLYEELSQSIDLKFGDTGSVPSFYKWVQDIILDGKPFTFERHEYLIEPYKDDHPDQTEMKATQLGLTSKAMLKAVYGARYGDYRGIMYLFPSKSDVTDFSKGRISPLIEDNPDSIGKWIQNTDSANIKKVWKAFLYFRGMKSKIGLKSVPADFIIFDELDEAPQNAVDMAMERMAHSEIKRVLKLSNPTLPDYGIDKAFCVSGNTKILRQDLRWIAAKNIKIGDELIGFDEEKPAKNRSRCYRATRVTSNNTINLPALKLYLDDGTTTVCSANHRWLTEAGTNIYWIYAKNLKVGAKLFSIGTWEEGKSKISGWIAGLFDGDGCIGITRKDGHRRKGRASFLSLSQKPGLVLTKAKRVLRRRGFRFYDDSYHRALPKSAHDVWIKGGLPERLRFLGIYRPVRLMSKSKAIWEDTAIGNDSGNTKKLKIIKIEELGTQPLIALGTQHKTFIADGMLSHNSETDQRYWLLKCKCGEYTCLEDTFPDCLLEVDNKVIRACQKCKAELNPSIGQWVAKHPSITDKRGRHYSQLFSHFVNPAEILHQFRTTNNLTDFYNLKIGNAYVEATNRLSVQEILALCGTEGIASQDKGPCFMGVDQGKDLHVVIGKRHLQKAGNIIHLGVYKDWEELDRLMKNFNVSRCVVDALPETRNARAFAGRHPGKVFLNYYNIHQKGAYSWNEQALTVSCNRTESLDASHNEIQNGEIVLPRECEIVREFANHLHNTAKRLEEDEETGSKRYIYVKLGTDHFRHAFNYEAMAREAKVSFFENCNF